MTIESRPAVMYRCSWHGQVDQLPCPYCPQQATNSWPGVHLITEAELQAYLNAHMRSIEGRLNEQRAEVARIVSEATRELRDQVGILEARIADQDSEIARLRAEVKTQRRLSIAHHSFLTTLDDGVSRIEVRIAGLERRLRTPFVT